MTQNNTFFANTQPTNNNIQGMGINYPNSFGSQTQAENFCSLFPISQQSSQSIPNEYQQQSLFSVNKVQFHNQSYSQQSYEESEHKIPISTSPQKKQEIDEYEEDSDISEELPPNPSTPPDEFDISSSESDLDVDAEILDPITYGLPDDDDWKPSKSSKELPNTNKPPQTILPSVCAIEYLQVFFSELWLTTRLSQLKN